ncbi:hypothetical protein ONZ45_g5427 [Pleurotus djamor]|nr:hypothetical protein ONZ45_g5427 [Pleurotus djamor]
MDTTHRDKRLKVDHTSDSTHLIPSVLALKRAAEQVLEDIAEQVSEDDSEQASKDEAPDEYFGIYKVSFRAAGMILRVSDEYNSVSHSEEHAALYGLLGDLYQSALLTNKTSSMWLIPILLHVGRLLEDGLKLGFDCAEVLGRDDDTGLGNDWQVWVAKPSHIYTLSRRLASTLPGPVSSSYIRQAGHVNAQTCDKELEIMPSLRKMLYLALKTGKSIIRGAVMDGLHFVFLLLVLNPDPSGPHPYYSSNIMRIADGEILESELKYVSEALAYWISHSHDDIKAENAFFKVVRYDGKDL